MNRLVVNRGSVAFRAETKEGYCLALKDINVSISYGEFIAVVGRNGSGKSTLARVISELLPLSKGTVQWSHAGPGDTRVADTCDGHQDSSSNRSNAANQPLVQMVFQNPDAQIIGETVYEDICFGLENFGIPSAEMPRRVQESLEQVGFNAELTQPVSSLSGGQKQLLCIASCLAVGAKVLVFDEATAMLNPASRLHILQLAQKLQAEGITVVWVTQWMEEAACANRIVALESGVIRFDGSPREFFYGPSSRDNVDKESVAKDQTRRADSKHSPQPTPCESLQMTAPYAVQVAQKLESTGISLPVIPLTIRELAEGVQQLCPSR